MRFSDLFCGCGGASLGLIRAGLRHHSSFDSNPDAVASYRILTGREATMADLESTPLSSLIGGFRGLIWASPPCQACSRMQNNRRDSRIGLMQNVLIQAITEFPDSWVVFENVDNVLRMDCLQPVFSAIYRSRGVLFDENRAKKYVVNASAFGVPQNRRRLVLPIPPAGRQVPPPLDAKFPPKSFSSIIGRGFRDHDPEHWGMTEMEQYAISGKILGYCPRNSWRDVPPCVLASKRVYLHSGKFNHPGADRRLSVGESMAIQALPRVRLAGDMASRYRQVGNAVPPPMAEAAVRGFVGNALTCQK
jgi:DNA (cytosine-5)-methyltransferase 1